MTERPKHRINRRAFLTIAGTAGVAAACSAPPGTQKLVPFLTAPDHDIPGVSLFYRTVCRECGAACGITARTREGRVLKLEGSPDDPIGRGALCARGQAALQGLYSPERIRGPMRRGSDGALAGVSWDDALDGVARALHAAGGADRAAGVRLLTRPEPGGAGDLQRRFLAGLGAGAERRCVLEPFELAPLRAGGRILFGRAELPAFDLAAARSVVSFGADFLETWLSPVELTRQFAGSRGVVGPERVRLTWIGPRLCPTAATADAWLAARAGSEAWVALGLLHLLCDPSRAFAGRAPEAAALFAQLGSFHPDEVERRSGVSRAALADLASELSTRSPSAVLGPGVSCSGPGATDLAVAVLLLNHVLGNVGRTVLYGKEPEDDRPSAPSDLRSLFADMDAGRVQVLLVHHADPVGALPSALGAARAIGRVPLIVSFSDRLDATTKLAHVVLPDHHPLESWGDVSPRRGIVGFSQPVMTPIWDTRSASQTLIDLSAKLPPPATRLPFDDAYAHFDSRVQSLMPGASEDQRFEARARGGVYAEAAPEPVSLRLPEPGTLGPGPAPPDGGDLDLVVFPTVLRFDGRSADVPWLREVPDPATTISWVSWAELAPATAERLGVVHGDVISIASPSGSAELPAYVYPGLHRDAVAVPLGGPEALALLPAAPEPRSGGVCWASTRVTVRPSGRTGLLPRSEGSPDQHGREIVRTVGPSKPTLPRPSPPRVMYPIPEHPKHRWAMAVDLDRCTGCQACIVACYAENNVPVTGAEAAAMGRNMGWIRLARYIGGDPARPRVDFLLMLCQHCSSAPCETVCPVYATFHTDEGLNLQVYNRCVGTRYCSNNCPYKARTFNWREPTFAKPLDWQLNPDVSVRSKGVMEKCSFCVQRIRAAELKAERENRPVRDGEVVPACAQTCPAGAIVFGDADDPRSRVSALMRDGRGYRLLEAVNTDPAITYLARVRDDA